MTAVPDLLAGLPTPAAVVADRGYDSNAVIELIVRSGAQASIPSCSRRIVRRSVDPAVYRQRNLIERFFCRIKQFRRIATRFDKFARNFLSAVLLAATRLWLRTYESTPWSSVPEVRFIIGFGFTQSRERIHGECNGAPDCTIGAEFG
jgi:transposase